MSTAKDQDAAPERKAVPAKEPLRVLIVEDQPADAELMVLRLQDEGFSPTWSRVETEVAFGAALDMPQDIILSDWRLPTFSGIRALRGARKRGLDTPFVIVSGSVGEEAAIDAMHEGADDYVLKDRLTRLGPAVRRALDMKRLRDEKELADVGLRQAAAVFDSSAEGVMLTGPDGTIIAVNRAFSEITGYSEAEARGKNPRMLKSGRQDETFYRDLWATITATGHWQGELWNRRKGGEVYPVWLSISSIPDDLGQPGQLVAVFSDLTGVKKAAEQLDFLAHHDALTGLPNRTLLNDRLEREIRRAADASRIAGIMILDVDRFGQINDGLGHVVGDALLIAIAGRISDRLGVDDSVARFGGDEFVVVLGNATSAAQVARRARAYQDSLAAPFQLEGNEVVATSGVGVSLYPNDGIDASTLLRRAQAALRQAKAGGRHQFGFVDERLAEAMQDRLALEQSLRGAVARRELVVHYQPQVDMADRTLVGVEALVRWQYPTRGLVPPMTFISLAEEMGIIGEIGEWVLAESCRQLAAWQAVGLSVPRVAVNLSAMQLEDPNLATFVRRALDAADIGPERLELEVTESVMMTQGETASTVLSDLRRLNVDLVMDDFGTGYSSLAQLTRMPLSRLKIDISFVRGIGQSAPEAIIRAIIAMSVGLGLQTVAEGVEREDQHTFLRDAGCDIGQGYLYGRPVPASGLLDAWLPR